MTTEIFTKEQFEKALPVHNETGNPLWKYAGLVKGEETYIIPIKGDLVIWVRSSVRSNGVCAETGGDSIRQWLMNEKTKSAISGESRTHRTHGWETRMTDKIRELYKIGLSLPLCPKCQSPMVKRDSKRGQFWGCSTFPTCRGTRKLAQAKEEKAQEPQQAAFDFLKEPGSSEVVEIPTGNDDSDDTPATRQVEETQVKPVVVKKDKATPNTRQLEAIAASVDANLRVLAPPGSGKTFLMIRRYLHLVENGVNPDSILVVTFSKSMADEMLARINAELPNLSERAQAQISTIHAMCYRILRSEGDRRQPAKEWQIKSILQEIAEELWSISDERPGWKEIIAWIDSAKMNGLSSTEDYEFFSKVTDKFGNNVGSKLHEARRLFDLRMSKYYNKKYRKSTPLLTFADMIFDIEQKLKRDSAFRSKWQARFEHVIVDESQDTSGQALRILITLSFEPGRNDVYQQ